jgi:hypothetical protein
MQIIYKGIVKSPANIDMQWSFLQLAQSFVVETNPDTAIKLSSTGKVVKLLKFSLKALSSEECYFTALSDRIDQKFGDSYSSNLCSTLALVILLQK